MGWDGGVPPSPSVAVRQNGERRSPHGSDDRARRTSFNGRMPGVPDADGAPDTANGDGIRIGAARILTLGANGTATAGTLYLHGRQRQFAVRVFGVTGRTRVLRYDAKTRKWIG